LLRVYTGVFFLYYGFGKLRRENFADGLAGFVNSNLESSFGFFRPFLENVVLPNAGVFAFLVAWGELLIGLALIFGLATRYAAISGAVLVSVFWFAKGEGFLQAQNHDAIWLIIFIVLAGVHGGRVMGVDARLAGRFRFLG
jgi:thiosulfate dehydrogenase [quinone] large subunit